MKHKIGIFGSADEVAEDVKQKARRVGEELGKRDSIVITGATSGIPYEASLAAHKNGAEIWGFSAARDLEEHEKFVPKHDISIYQRLVFVPKDYPFVGNIDICRKYRNVTSTASSDAGIIINGRWGTLNEFTNLNDMGKVIGVLTGVGGVAEELPGLCEKVCKNTGCRIFFDNNPEKLVEKVISELNKK